MSSPRPTEVRLHLGAHKTASTHLQSSLQRHRPALAALGIDFVPTRELRRTIRHQPHWLFLPGGRVRALRAALGELVAGLPVLAISEENLLGEVADALAPRPYPRLEVRCGIMARAVGRAHITPCLAIRSFDRFWASCLVEVIRSGVAPPPLPAPVSHPPSWLEICRRIRRIFPAAPLTVWRHEDYDPRRAATALLGRDPGPLPGVARFTRRASPSPEGIRLALSAVRAAGAADAAATVAAEVSAIFDAHPAVAGAEPFRPFDVETGARLREAYATDLAALAAEPGIRLLPG